LDLAEHRHRLGQLWGLKGAYAAAPLFELASERFSLFEKLDDAFLACATYKWIKVPSDVGGVEVSIFVHGHGHTLGNREASFHQRAKSLL
jgi:hypothetical protein